ncbi:hypothetical protein TEA_021086 [Camellia sinensis var. sinensis]|uniref:WAT1-related protein n=1 Tax=Camellia sinensis var. sinensis TaxID=542762 RepID=A0A4S4DXV4_CAMSN|nr:hypothetical protein TEA_021086 [Camellia sinensis var. sinensis]
MGKKRVEKMKLLVALLVLQLCFAGFHIVSRLALNIGVSKVVYPVYRNIIALLLLSPFAYFLEKITANQGFYILGLYYANPTFASAMQNSVPAITFVMASAIRSRQLKGPVVKKYPAKLSMTSFTIFFGLIQFLIIAAFVETDPDRWKIQSAEEIFTILYAGIVSSGIVISLQTWCIYKGGPVFVAIFQPVQTVLVAIMAFAILGDQLYLGGIIGAILIVFGLYLVLWGQKQRGKVTTQDKTRLLRKPLLDSDSKDTLECDIP